MKNITELELVVNQIKSQIQQDFVIDETAVLDEIENNDEHKTGIVLKVLSIIGGVLASLAFLGFLAIAGLFESEYSMIGFGGVCLAASLFMIANADKLVFATITVSFYIIGYTLIIAGLNFLRVQGEIVSLIVLILASVSLVISGNWIFAFVSTLIIHGSLLSLIMESGHSNIINLYLALALYAFFLICINEAYLITVNKTVRRLYEPIRHGTLVSTVCALFLVGVSGLITLDYRLLMIFGMVSVGCIVLLGLKLFKTLEIEKNSTKLMIIVCSVLVVLPTIMAPAITGSMLIILTCFYVNYKLGIGLGIIALVFFLGRFYYDLNLTLLTKSFLLMISGAVFFVCYFITVKKIRSHE